MGRWRGGEEAVGAEAEAERKVKVVEVGGIAEAEEANEEGVEEEEWK